MNRETIDNLRRALTDIQAGPVVPETVETLAAGLSDLTSVVSALLDDIDATEAKAERRAAIEGSDESMYPLVVTGIPVEIEGARGAMPVAVAREAARRRIVIGVFRDGNVRVLKNNLGPHEAIKVVSW